MALAHMPIVSKELDPIVEFVFNDFLIFNQKRVPYIQVRMYIYYINPFGFLNNQRSQRIKQQCPLLMFLSRAEVDENRIRIEKLLILTDS